MIALDNDKRFSIEVYNALRELGIPAHVRGYEYLKSGMTFLRQKPNAIYNMTKEFYPGVAAIHGENVQPSHVERGIRHAIGLSKADDATWYKVLGKTGHFTNAEFLATLNESIKVKMAVEKCS